jgi:uncharacterized protein (TIGR02246 family)
MSHDERAIHDIVARCEAAWNAGDGAAWAVSFTEDADFVDIRGAHSQGRAAIEAGHQRIFDTIYKGSRVEYRVDRLRLVRPDVAIAFLHARLWSRLAVAADDPRREARIGAAMTEQHARPTMILAKALDRWQIVAFQNTRVAPASG